MPEGKDSCKYEGMNEAMGLRNMGGSEGQLRRYVPRGRLGISVA